MSINPAQLSAGAQVNMLLDSLGLPDAYGDRMGAMVDMQRGDMGGYYRNVMDLHSGLPTAAFNNIMGSAGRPEFGRAHFPRMHQSGPHLRPFRHTYTTHEHVGHRVRVGQKYGFNVGPFKLQGRISGKQYAGSFAKPIRLANKQYLFRGRMYQNMGGIMKDMKDGRIDGLATRRHTVFGSIARPRMTRLGNIASQFNPSYDPMKMLGNIFGQQGGLMGGIPQNAGVPQNAGASDILSQNIPIEDKVMLLMAKLSQGINDEINGKMQELNKAMDAQKQQGSSGAGGASGGGGIFGSLFKGIGSVFGAAAGGPVGSMAGGMLGGIAGNLLGGATGGATGGTAQAGGQKQDTQMLQMQLQQLMQKKQQMFSTMSTMLKNMHEMSMGVIRNLKV